MTKAKRRYTPGYVWHYTQGYWKQVPISVRGSSHKGWVKEYLGGLEKAREEKWTDSITVVTRSFVQNVHVLLGFRTKGKDVIEGAEGYQLWKASVPYNALFGAKKADIIITYGKSKETLHCRTHLAQYASMPQEGIPAKIF